MKNIQTGISWKKICLCVSLILAAFTTQAQHYDWAHNIGGRFGDEGNLIVADAAGNIYVAGEYSDTVDFDPSANEAKLATAGLDIFIAKYTASGSYQWATSIGSTFTERPRGMAIDAAGNIYITGSFEGTVDFDPSTAVSNLTSNGSSDIFIAKYDATGKYVWAMGMGNSRDWDAGGAITVDKANNVYVTGYFSGTADFDASANTANLTAIGNEDIFVAKYDAAGTYQWANRLGGSMYEFGDGISTDDSGNVYVTGHFEGRVDFDPSAASASITAVRQDIFLAKYDPTGKYIWAIKLGGDNDDLVGAITTDANGNCYLTGTFREDADFDPSTGVAELNGTGDDDIYIAKYNRDGAYVWAHSIGGTSSDNSNGIVLGKNNNIYITGAFEGTIDFDPSSATANLSSPSNMDVFLARYDTSGKYINAISLGGADAHDDGNGIAVDADGNAYITGTFSGTVDFDPSTNTANQTASGSTDAFIARYTLTPPATAISNINSTDASVILYPNPAKDLLTVSISLQTVHVDIYSADGKLMLHSDAGNMHQLKISGFAPGIYIVKAGSEVLKFVKE